MAWDMNHCGHGNKITWTQQDDGFLSGVALECRICKASGWTPCSYKPCDISSIGVPLVTEA